MLPWEATRQPAIRHVGGTNPPQPPACPGRLCSGSRCTLPVPTARSLGASPRWQAPACPPCTCNGWCLPTACGQWLSFWMCRSRTPWWASAGTPLFHYPPSALWCSPWCLGPFDTPAAGTSSPPSTHLSLLIPCTSLAARLEHSGPTFKAQLRHHLPQEAFPLPFCTETSLLFYMLIFNCKCAKGTIINHALSTRVSEQASCHIC